MGAAQHRLPSGKPWEAFCDALQKTGNAVVASTSSSALDCADGIRHVALLTETALKWYFLGNDPEYPRFVSLNDTPEIADNRFAAVRGDLSYLVRGNIASLFDINISLHEGWGFLGQRKVWGDIGRQDLDVREDGNFEITLSATRTPGNWLYLPPEATLVQIREYYEDWALHRPGSFEIIRLGSEGRAPGRIEPAAIAAKLDAASRWVEGYLESHRRMIENRYPREDNAVLPPNPQAAGNKNIQYGFGKFRLADGECLVLEFEKPRARLWNVQWLLSPWYENPDIANRFTSLNGRDAFVHSDGRVRVVLCGSDPGVPNWIDTSGYAAGVFVIRWIWCEGSPAITTVLTTIEELPRRLPADTPRVAAAERVSAQARRRSHFAYRGR